MPEKWGGARPGAGRPASGFTERITLDVSPLMKEAIERHAYACGKPRNEVLRLFIGKALGMGRKMEWDSSKGLYKGVSSEGRIIIVDGDEYAEARQDAEKEGADISVLESPATWEHLIGDNDGVRYEDASPQQKPHHNRRRDVSIL